MEFKKAERKQAKLRLAIASPSGGGKTYSALKIAQGLGGRIALVDTEHGSGSLYADTAGMPEYSVLELAPPFSPQRYIGAINAAEKAGFHVLIVDSLSHAWAGEGGVLDMHEMARAASKSGNSWTAWREVTPQHALLIEAMLQSSCHIIATMRSKQEYAQVQEEGKVAIKKLGLAPVQREGMDYEFTVVLDLSMAHIATASKDRTGLFDGQHFTPSEETGQRILLWLNSAAVKPPGDAPAKPPAPPAKPPAPPAKPPAPPAAAPPKSMTPLMPSEPPPGEDSQYDTPPDEEELFPKASKSPEVGLRQALRDIMERRWPGKPDTQTVFLEAVCGKGIKTVEQVPSDLLVEALQKAKPKERPQAKS